MKPGWKTSEAWLTGGTIPAILTLASMATPHATKVTSIVCVAALSGIYTASRTALKAWLSSNHPPTAQQLGKFLESQFPFPAAGSSRTSTATAPKRADLEKANAS